MANIKHVTVALYHQDCYCSMASEKFPEIEMKLASPIQRIKENSKTVDYEGVWKIKSETQKELDDFLSFLRDHRATKKIIMLSKKNCEANLLHAVNGPNLSYDAVLDSNTAYTSQPWVKNGHEIHSVVTDDPNNIKKLLMELECIGEVKILRIGDYRPDMQSGFGLTEKQKTALRLALVNGYYEWPKRITLEELAQLDKTSRRSLQERLRRAERKILPRTIEQILNE